MQSIYSLVDSVDFNINHKEANRAYQIAINIPLFIASGIGQLNMKVRIKKFNDVSDNLEDLTMLLNHFEDLSWDQREYLNNIEECRIQVVKLLNSYFGRLKISNMVVQVR